MLRPLIVGALVVLAALFLVSLIAGLRVSARADEDAHLIHYLRRRCDCSHALVVHMPDDRPPPAAGEAIPLPVACGAPYCDCRQFEAAP